MDPVRHANAPAMTFDLRFAPRITVRLNGVRRTPDTPTEDMETDEGERQQEHRLPEGACHPIHEGYVRSLSGPERGTLLRNLESPRHEGVGMGAPSSPLSHGECDQNCCRRSERSLVIWIRGVKRPIEEEIIAEILPLG